MPTCENTCTNDPRTRRFQSALESIISLTERERHGIGMQKEKSLHAVLKAYEDPDEDHQEIPIDKFIADIYNDGRITEIQTANLGSLREKLDCFLKDYEVTVVYPIPARKYVTWIDPETGELGKRSLSPKRGSFYHAFKELYKISSYLDHSNLNVKLILIDMEEYRVQDGWDRTRKRGSHRYDRMPTAIVDEMLLTQPMDYMQFIPYDIEEPFTAKELAIKCGFKRKSDNFSTVALVLNRLGVLERVGKRGRAYLYRVSESETL